MGCRARLHGGAACSCCRRARRGAPAWCSALPRWGRASWGLPAGRLADGGLAAVPLRRFFAAVGPRLGVRAAAAAACLCHRHEGKRWLAVSCWRRGGPHIGGGRAAAWHPGRLRLAAAVEGGRRQVAAAAVR